MTGWNEPIQFFAREAQAIECLAPLWRGLDVFVRGEFFVPRAMLGHAEACGVQAVGLRGAVNTPLEVKPPASSAPLVTTSYRDLLISTRINAHRPQIHWKRERFVGAALSKVSVFLCGDETMQEWLKKQYPKAVSYQLLAVSPVEAVEACVKARSNLRTVTQVDGESVGIVYVAFGEKAAQAVRVSAMSLRRVGLQMPICVVGDTPVAGMEFIRWTGESPFDARQRSHFQFRAGRIKPFLYGLSPFDRTLYLDADTEFMADITPGFEALSAYDVAIARENLTLGQLYNKMLAGWEINIKERDATITELNAGVATMG
jgi:hypothetical protein